MQINNVAVLAWGSLVNQVESPVYGSKLEIETSFAIADRLKLPIRMSRLSSKDTDNRRITLVIDRNATDEKVYAATSAYHNLQQARANLRAREGTTDANISYLKCGRSEGNEEEYNVDGQYWSGHRGAELSQEKAQQIIQWAKRNHFGSVIWAGLSPNITSGTGESGSRGREILAMLQNDPILLANTQDYIRHLPYTTILQQKILRNEIFS